MPKSWLQSIPDLLLQAESYIPSLEDIKDSSRYGTLSTLPGGKLVDPLITGASQVARPIGALAGVVGEQFSEANKTPELPLDESGNQVVPSLEDEIAGNRAYDKRGYDALSAAKEGADLAPETLRKTVNALDVASLATGGAAGALGKVAPLAAKGFNVADTALSGIDALLGTGHVAKGIETGDLAEVGTGLFRVAANVAGGLSSARNIMTDGATIEPPVEARHTRSHKGPIEGEDYTDDALAFLQKPQADISQQGYSSRFADVDYTPEQLAPLIYDTREMKSSKWQPLDGSKYAEPNGDFSIFKTGQIQPKDAVNGEHFTLESVNDQFDYRNGKVTASEAFNNSIQHSPTLARYAGWIRMLEASAQDEIIGKLSAAIDPIYAPDSPGATTNPMVNLTHSGKFRGIATGSASDGFTWADKGEHNITPQKIKIKGTEIEVPEGSLRMRGTMQGMAGQPTTKFPDYNRAYYVNPKNIADRVTADWDRLLKSGKISGYATTKYLEQLSPELREYVDSVWQGGTRAPELDDRFRAEIFMRENMYTALHEAFGHSRPDSRHVEGARTYRAPARNLVGGEVGTAQNIVNLKNISPDRISSFEPMHNTIVEAMDDPRMLQAAKAIPVNDQIAMYKLFSGEDPDLAKDVKRVSDRVNARREHNDAAMKYAPVENAPTPPAQVPPGSSGGEPQGPQLPSLAKRIKQSLADNIKAKNTNDMKMREVNAVRAEALRANEEKFAGQMISADDFSKERGKILRGDYDLIKGVDPMAVTEAERYDMMNKIMASSQDDAFKRNRAQEAFKKMIDGDRLEMNEIQLVREVIGERIAINEQDPAIIKMLKFFANTTGSARALMTAYDVSAAGRQALYAAPMNPRAVKEAFKAQISALKMTRPEFQSFMARLQDPMYNPFAEMSKAAGLHFSESMDSVHPEKMEEAFYSGKWAEKIPGVRQSEQAYIAYLNKMRTELFNKHAKVMLDAGEEFINPETGAASQKLQDLAYMVNTLTGRGELALFHTSPNSPLGKKLGLTETLAPGKETADKMHAALTSVFFAPRFAASRAALMRDTVQALVGGGLDPAISKIYMKNVFGTISAVTATMGALAAMGVGTFNTDPRKKDFGVLKVGNTRYDSYGGLKPWAKIASVIASDKYFSGAYNIPQKYGDKMGSKTKTGEIGRFVQGKLSPAAGFLLEGLTGEDFMGRKSQLMRNAYEHSFPMVIQTIAESVEANEADQLPLAVPLSMVGIGVNSYTDKRFKR